MQEKRSELCYWLKKLPELGLVTWTSGNVSVRVENGFLIKPSGIAYTELTPGCMALVRFSTIFDGLYDGLFAIETTGGFKPSVDTPAHGYIYHNLPEAESICHTHSPYATAFAMCGRGIPVCSTMMADVLGGPIPCIAVRPGDREGMGLALVQVGMPAVLLQNHGVLVAGGSLSETLKLACAVEEAARLQYLAKQVGGPCPLPEMTVKRLRKCHEEDYGQ